MSWVSQVILGIYWCWVKFAIDCQISWVSTVSFRLLELGEASFRKSKNELGELGDVSFGILKLGEYELLNSGNELGEVSFGIFKID